MTSHSVPTSGRWRMYIRRPIGSCVRSFWGRGGDKPPGAAGSPRRQGSELQQLEDSTPQRDPESGCWDPQHDGGCAHLPAKGSEGAGRGRSLDSCYHGANVAAPWAWGGGEGAHREDSDLPHLWGRGRKARWLGARGWLQEGWMWIQACWSL